MDRIIDDIQYKSAMLNLAADLCHGTPCNYHKEKAKFYLEMIHYIYKLELITKENENEKKKD